MAKKTSVPRVAVITRTKDRQLLLERAIKSVHNQTMGDFVHVIINDGGDPTPVDDLVERYKDIIKGRVRVIHNKESHGMEAASNKAIKSTDSDFIAIHDDDDTWHVDFLRRTTAYLEKTGEFGVVVATDRIDERIHDDVVEKIDQYAYLPDMHFISLYRQCLDNQMTPITFIYRRDVFKKIGMYDEDLKVCGDWDFGIRFVREFDVGYISKYGALAYYHHRPESEGADANSVFQKKVLFERTLNYLRNKYLREDIISGKMGVGYIMNSMEYLRTLNGEVLHQLDEKTVRIEGHINYSIEKYRKGKRRGIFLSRK